jgi:hypothetical protein
LNLANCHAPFQRMIRLELNRSSIVALGIPQSSLKNR